MQIHSPRAHGFSGRAIGHPMVRLRRMSLLPCVASNVIRKIQSSQTICGVWRVGFNCTISGVYSAALAPTHRLRRSSFFLSCRATPILARTLPLRKNELLRILAQLILTLDPPTIHLIGGIHGLLSVHATTRSALHRNTNTLVILG